MFRFLVVLCCALTINGQLLEQHPAPEPYSFAFSSPNEDGTASSREETGDANGRVTGSYTILGADGQQRRVEYVADENGFRANVITNEIGTESQNAADVLYQSSAPTAAELSAQWEASGAGKARLQAVGAIGVSRQALIQQGPGLVSAPLIGGGLAQQTLRVNQGLRVSGLPRPVSRIAHLPTPVLAQPIAQQVALPIAPLALGGGIAKATLGNGLGIGSTFGIRAAPVGYNSLNLGQIGVGLKPLGVNGVSFQQLGQIRNLQGQQHGITLLSGNNGQYGNSLLTLSNNGVQPVQHESGLSTTNIITQRTETNEDYGRKSK